MVSKRLAIFIIALGLILAVQPAPTAHAQDESWLIAQVNGLRAGLGLSGLSPNSQLSAAAAQHSAYMATSCDVSHTESNGSTPSSRAAANGYPGSRVNENIYGGMLAQAGNAWSFWLNSGSHYQAMVDARINEIGVGVASGDCGHYFTMLVGYNDGVSAPPPPEQPADTNADAALAGDAVPADDVAPANAEAPATAIVIPPTQQPYVPPPPSRTPTATVLTLTPSPTWTITPTRTPSPTGTVQPPTSTAILLPTVPLPGEATAVALAALPTTGPPSLPPTASPSPTATPPPVQQSVSGDGFDPRDLLPVALVGQVVLIGVVGFVYFRRQQR